LANGKRTNDRKPTIATVAERAGVAVSTVSRFLNGHYVSQEARARLAEVIEELGYVRSWTARNLSLGLRGCVGVVVDSSQDLWFTQLLAGIEEELSTRDTSLMLASLELSGRYDPRIVQQWIRERRVDGVILVKSQRRERALVHECMEAQLPTVMVAPDEAVAHVHVVRCDNRAAGAAVAHHLANLGHKRIAFAGGPEHSVDTKQRLSGLRDGLEERGIRLDMKRVSYCASYEADAGCQFASEVLKTNFDFTALVTGNDALALGFMRIAQQHGIRIPERLSVAGFDNIPEGALLWPGLTTVAQPTRDMGRAACQKLFEAIANPGEQQVLVYPVDLVVRESTAPPTGRPV
jgi:LacI family transcriptional regulator